LKGFARIEKATPRDRLGTTGSRTLKMSALIESGGLGALPSEGKGQKFESSRARHDFNDFVGIAEEQLITAEASRKHAKGNTWTDCRTFVGELAGSCGRHRNPSRQ
jgi:hypothetical protein